MRNLFTSILLTILVLLQGLQVAAEEYNKVEIIFHEEGEKVRNLGFYPFLDPVSSFVLYGHLGGGLRIGKLDREVAQFLRTELAGTVINPYFLNVDRGNADFSGFDVRDVKYGIIDPFGIFSNDEWDFFFGYSLATSHLRFSSPRLSANGNQTAILSPAGPAGALGGGAVTAPGFGDVTNINYMDSYEEDFFRVGIQNTFRVSDNVSWTPRFGYAYGRVEEESKLSGVTNGGTFPFQYHNKIDTDRHMLEVGSQITLKLTPEISAYLDGDVRLIHNDAAGSSRLDAGPFVPEIGMAALSETDVGGRVGAGVLVGTDMLQGRFGVEYETWNIPVLHASGTQPAYLLFQKRDSIVARAEVFVILRPSVVSPEE
ncbi:MAG: hypothetical protein ACR2OX_02785 [Methyloligellaceae bacterium]